MFLMDADGSNKVNLTDNLIQGRAPAFSRDGSRIAFQGTVGIDSEIYVMNADKSGFPINVSSNTTDDKDPDFSPAEDKIVYANFDDVDVEYELYTVYADGINSENPVFSPDGSRIVFAANEGGTTDNEIYIIQTTGRGGVTQLTDNSENDNRPVFSPDGSVVAFHEYDGSDWEIYMWQIATAAA